MGRLRGKECHLKFPRWWGSPFPLHSPTPSLCHPGSKPQVRELSPGSAGQALGAHRCRLAPHLLSCSCTHLRTCPKIFLLPKWKGREGREIMHISFPYTTKYYKLQFTACGAICSSLVSSRKPPGSKMHTCTRTHTHTLKRKPRSRIAPLSVFLPF